MEALPDPEALWRASGSRLRAWFERHTGDADAAEDLVQETFVRVHERMDTLLDASSVRAWVGRIARHVWIDHLRRRTPEPAPEDGLEPADAELEPDASLDRTVAGWLEGHLAELEPEDAHALRRVDLEGRTQAELAAETGLSLSGAKSRVQRARARLRARLEACCAFAFDARGGIVGVRRRADGHCEGACEPSCD